MYFSLNNFAVSLFGVCTRTFSIISSDFSNWLLLNAISASSNLASSQLSVSTFESTKLFNRVCASSNLSFANIHSPNSRSVSGLSWFSAIYWCNSLLLPLDQNSWIYPKAPVLVSTVPVVMRPYGVLNFPRVLFYLPLYESLTNAYLKESLSGNDATSFS